MIFHSTGKLRVWNSKEHRSEEVDVRELHFGGEYNSYAGDRGYFRYPLVWSTLDDSFVRVVSIERVDPSGELPVFLLFIDDGSGGSIFGMNVVAGTYPCFSDGTSATGADLSRCIGGEEERNFLGVDGPCYSLGWVNAGTEGPSGNFLYKVTVSGKGVDVNGLCFRQEKEGA